MVLTQLLRIPSIQLLEEKLACLSIQYLNSPQIRGYRGPLPKPRLRNPTWFTKKNRVLHDDLVTKDNQEFVSEVVHDKYEKVPNVQPPSTQIEWSPAMKRTGVIARKIGELPLWLKTGKKQTTTLLQVLDNHVIRKYAADEYECPRQRVIAVKNKMPMLLLGAEAVDPALLTKEYCGIFKNTGLMPKKHLARFFVSSDATLPPGTPITALHFNVGNYVDIRGKTIDRGFQGVMKKHGFKGMPASHGVTKTHRRGGNIGGGGEKGRVWPGTRMPGNMGNRWRITKGLKIWRINTKYNVLWVSGPGIPGEINSIVTIYDTVLPLKKPTKPLPFPTYFGTDEDMPEDLYDESVHKFMEPSINFDE